MKNIKILSFGLASLLTLASCSSKFLDTEMTGDSLTQEEYDKIEGATVASVPGLYVGLYQFGGEHHSFGQKSFDIAHDLEAGDMALTMMGYGWFSSDAALQNYNPGGGRNSEIWVTYYTIIKNANSIIRTLSDKSAEEALTDDEKSAYGQALTLRAFCYFNMSWLYASPLCDPSECPIYGGSGNDYRTVPYYDGSKQQENPETGLILEQDLQTVGFIHETVKADLKLAIQLFDESQYARPSKLNVNGDVARALLAYTYLHSRNVDTQKADYQEAYNLAKGLIDAGKYPLLKKDQLLTNGFNSILNPSWMWGLDVTIDNSTGLASFFGHMDMFTYGYGWIQPGILAIDDAFYAEIPDTDTRKQWFNANAGQDGKIILNSYNKFFDQARNAVDPDRNWTNDIVYMRIEEMYLVAAEAAYRAGNTQDAIDALKLLLDERDETAAAALTASNIKEQIYYNWRVEMWGEGKSLMTLKRFDFSKKRGKNHYMFAEKPVDPCDYQSSYYLTYQVPYSESTQNMAITKGGSVSTIKRYNK